MRRILNLLKTKKKDREDRKDEDRKDEDREVRETIPIDLEIKRKHDLSFLQAALFGFIENQADKETGSWGENENLIFNKLGIKSKDLSLEIKILQEKKLLWITNFSNWWGYKRRRFVLKSTYNDYVNYFCKEKRFDLVVECQKFFNHE